MKVSNIIGALGIAFTALCAPAMGQSWQPLANKAPFSAGVPLLLTDGSVLVHSFGASQWWKLKPDLSGNYVNGTWTQAASLPAGYAPLYYASAVLADGRVIVMGGEYNNLSAVWSNRGAIYDPVADAWSELAPPPGWFNIGDAQCTVLPDGRFMIANPFDTRMAILDPNTLTWTAVGTGKTDRFDEEGWTLMPDGTILTLDAINNPATEKYIPWLDAWMNAGSTPQSLVNTASQEMGPTVLRPDGTVFAMGATGHNAVYTPGATATDLGTWTSAPDFPIVGGQQLDIADGPACLLPSGNVLCGASPGIFQAGTHFFEFDGTSLAEVPSTPHSPANSSYVGNMLMLPTGQVLYTDFSSDVQVYTPAGAPNDAWRPTITNLPQVLAPNQTITIEGTQFNGLSQCSSYGDDSTNATNYPLVRITNFVTNHVLYCRTSNHSTMAVATGALPTSTTVVVPPDVEPGPCGVEVVTNGIASATFFATIGTGLDVPIISGLTPKTIQANTGPVQLTVNGFQFHDGDAVTWTAGAVTTNLTATFVSANVLTTTVPAELTLDPGTAAVKVIRDGGVVSNSSTFTISTDAPIVLSLTPAETMASANDVTVTIAGNRFRSDDTVNWTMNGVTTPLTSQFVSSTQVTAVVPASLTINMGSALISVTNARGRTSNGATFTVTTDVPSIFTVTPNTIPAFSPDTTITLDGIRFRSGDTVQWNMNGVSTDLTATFVSVNQMTATIPASLLTTSGPTFLTITDAKGQVSNQVAFTVTNPVPVLTSLSPATLPFGSPTFTLTLTGNYFMNGATVSWRVGSSKTALQATFVNSTTMTAIVPATLLVAPGKANVTIGNPAPGGGEASLPFSISGIVKLSAVSPKVAVVGESFALTAKGSGFLPGAKVKVGNVQVAATVTSDIALSATIPGSAFTAAGSVNVTILNPDGGVSNAVVLPVNNAVPTIVSINPSTVTAGSPSFTLVVTGSKFMSGTSIQWNGKAINTTYVSGTELRATIAASQIAKKGSVTITVLNPAPGGGGSNKVTLTIQ